MHHGLSDATTDRASGFQMSSPFPRPPDTPSINVYKTGYLPPFIILSTQDPTYEVVNQFDAKCGKHTVCDDPRTLPRTED